MLVNHLTSHLCIQHVAGAIHMMGVEKLNGKMQKGNIAAVNKVAPIITEPKLGPIRKESLFRR